jgi:hypothetical protein
MEFLSVAGFLIVLIITTVITLRANLKKCSEKVYSSKYILNKFEPDNTAPKITEMIEFHKSNESLSKYNVR